MKRLSAFLLVLAAVSASAQTADLRRDLERMDRRLRVLEAAPEIRVLSRPGMVPQQWTEVPGWRTIELVPAGGTTFETTSSQKTVRVVVRTTGGAGPLSVTNGIGGDGGASPLRVKLGAGLAFDGDGNVVLSMPDYAYFSRGITLGTNAWTNAAGTLRRAPDGFRPQVSDGANWYPVGDLSDAPSDTNAYARKGGAWVPVPTNPAADVAAVAYGTGTNEAYRGDWGAAISNAAVLRSIATVPASDAYSAPASESLPFVVTDTGALTLSGLTAGSIGIRLTTTNASGIALYAAVVKDGDGETIATINPACDGSEQSARWPWNASETLTVEASGIASPVEGAESAIITAAQVETWADVSLVGRTNDLADQHLYVDYPAATNEAANRAYADDAADAALALALGEIATATFDRDLAGFVQRWNPRFDTVAASNSLSTLYGGSTALRLDSEGAAVVPEIRAFAVEAGEVATLTVWSYSGGATNLVPEVTTNLITGTWEKKPESIVSATNIDAFTAQVVFTNDFERLLYVRLVDVSGGSGVPVFRVFGGIAFGDGEAITDWPQGTILGATVNEPHTVATNDGILAFTVTADGSGFPLTNDVSADGFDLEKVDRLSATNGRFNSLVVSNGLVVLGTTALRDTVVTGNLTVVGTYYAISNVVTTTYVDEVVYATQEVFQATIVYTNVVTTNSVYTYVNGGGTWDATNAAWVGIPGLLAVLGGTNSASSTWDFSAAAVRGLPFPTAAQAGQIATNVVAANWTAEEFPEPVVPVSGVATVWSTGRWLRSYAPDTSVATLRFERAAGSLTNAAIVPLYFRCGTNVVYFRTNNLLGFSTNGIKTDGSTNLVFAESPPGSTNFHWDLRR